MSHKKFGPDRFSRIGVYWIQTDRQTNKHPDTQAKFIYRLRFLRKQNFATRIQQALFTPPPPSKKEIVKKNRPFYNR